jgi:hypothetical protein
MISLVMRLVRWVTGFLGRNRQEIPKFASEDRQILVLSEDDIPTVRPSNRIPPVPIGRLPRGKR